MAVTGRKPPLLDALDDSAGRLRRAPALSSRESVSRLAPAVAVDQYRDEYARGMTQADVALSRDERDLLAHGLFQWGGPAQATDALARVMGFQDVDDLYCEGDRIAEELRSGASLSAADLGRA